MQKSVLERLAIMDISFQSLMIEPPRAIEPAPLPSLEPEIPFENEFQNWSSDWLSGIERIQYLLQHTQDAALQKLLADLELGYDTLVAHWEQFERSDPRKWSVADLSKLDLSLCSTPALPKSLEGDTRTQSVFQKTAFAITQLQSYRREEIRARGVERIEGTPGLTEQIAREIEHDIRQPSAMTEQPELAGKFCRIEPGMGGYRFQGQVLRLTSAVFYKYRLPGA